MSATAATTSTEISPVRASWFPMLIIALAQIQMSFNVSALPVSVGGIVEDFNTSPTAVSTALVIYSLAVAGLVMLGAKLGQRYGARRAFQIGAAGHGVGMLLMVFATSPSMIFAAQAVAGAAAALLVPALVVMIATHYQGKQQGQALGYLQSAQAIAGVMAFLVAGALATAFGWRASYVLICGIAVVVLFLSFRLKNVPAIPTIKIDWIGAVFIAVAMVLISLGFDNLNRWGPITATDNAPVDLFGLSPAPLMIIIGVVFGQAFFYWQYQRVKKELSPLLALETVDSGIKISAVFCLLIIGSLGPAITFLIPLYIQIVQGRSEFQTSLALIPYSLSIFAAAFLSVRLFDRLTPRVIGTAGFAIVAIGLTFLAFVIQNEWNTALVLVGLIVTGLGEGALLTLMFNIMVRTSPSRFAGDVGALRGTANNLSNAVGTALAAVLVIGVLSANVSRDITYYSSISPELVSAIDLNNVDFVSNDRLESTMTELNASPEDIVAAKALNETARLRALKVSFLILAALALLALVPSFLLPSRKLDEFDPNLRNSGNEPPRPDPVQATATS
ncbi:MAG: MFS transporter [Anaerolineae bacterium]